MPDYDTVLFHGSCIAVDGAAYLFAAKSGTGKSTHTRLWREYLGERAFMVNDDKPLIRVQDGRALVFGTPWDGKHHLSRNTAVPLRALCILQRAARNSIEPVSAAQSLPMLLQQVYRPADGEALKKTLALVESLATSVSLWRLGCNMDIEAAQIAYNAMKG
jgi:serine kinase of HPr protein (carbohydrate metabolism regulator)